MKQEDKELLLKDLCTRLPYGVKLQCGGVLIGKTHQRYMKERCDTTLYSITEIYDNCYAINARYDLIEIKPYLRPMSSMTEEEWEELNRIGHIVPLYDGCFGVDMRAYCKNSQPHYRRFSEFPTIEDWFNAHHFDYRGLIEKGLALEAPEGMYNIKEK